MGDVTLFRGVLSSPGGGIDRCKLLPKEELFSPFQSFKSSIVGEVGADGGDGDVAGHDGIGVKLKIRSALIEADEAGDGGAVGQKVEVVAIDGGAHLREEDLLARGGEVDVEDVRLGEHVAPFYLIIHSSDVLDGVGEIFKRGGEGEGLHAEHGPLEARAHGARIVDVRAEVGAFIDARDDEVELLLHAENGDAHAVGGGGIDAVGLDGAEEVRLLHLIAAAVDVDGVAGRALLRLGGDDSHLPQMPCKFHEVG